MKENCHHNVAYHPSIAKCINIRFTKVCVYVSDRCMMDSDDEVRDRATFYMNVLQQKQKALNAAYIFNGEGLCWSGGFVWVSIVLRS